MISKSFFEDINQVAEEKNLTREQVLYAFEQGLISGCKKQHGVRTCRVEFKEEKNEILVYRQYFVLSEDYLNQDIDKDYTMITLAEAKQINQRAKPGDILEVKVDPKGYNLYAIRDMKNRFNELLGQAHRESIYQNFKQYEHEMIGARVIAVEETFYRVELDRDVITMLPKKEALPTDSFHIGDRIKVFVTDVEMKTKGPKIYVSRLHPTLIKRLLEDNVPEIKSGIIEIVGIARDPGDRTKIGLRTLDPKIDPIGSTVGPEGSRIREIVKALSGEKIDLFRWSDNEKDLIANALQPAQVVKVTNVDPRNKEAIAIVKDDQLSLAIGKMGQNVKLAVQATGWSIDIKSESDAAKEGIIY